VSVPRNVVKVEQLRVSGVPVNLATTFNSGDLMIWQPGYCTVRPATASDAGSASSAANFVGVSNDTNPIANLGQNLPVARIAIITRGLVQMNVGDLATYFPGDLVTFGNDPQTVTKSGASSGNYIGIVAAENFFSVTGGAVVGLAAPATILIYLKPQFTNLTSL